ncbi:MAG: acyl transferase [Chitinophagaceae bacterium]
MLSDECKTSSQLFESSGTTDMQRSKHFVYDTVLYEQAILYGFQLHFGSPKQYCILGLLPSYLERPNSSLVYMVTYLMKLSEHPQNNFYLHDFEKLTEQIIELEKRQQPTLLFGVTFALLDWIKTHSLPLKYVTIIETGGMKGKAEELTKQQLHNQLQQAFGEQCKIYSEYGMTELLSQAYSTHQLVFTTPPWMKICIREMNDPFTILQEGRGLINVIDLANIYSCAFIATDDIADIKSNGQFTLLGRSDYSEWRGCSMLSL